MGGTLTFEVLGPLQIKRDGEAIDAGGAKFMSVVALLLLREGEAVGTEALVDAIWGEAPPPTADTALRGHVSRLRKLLKEDPTARLETRGSGYVLTVGDQQLDLRRFERLVEQSRSALGRGEYADAEESLRDAMVLWRGEPLSDLDLPSPPIGELAALRELRASAFEALIEAELALGHHAEAIPQLELHLRDDPLNERLHALAALAHYRAGRQADALQVLERLRKSLSSELGLDPGAAIEQLEHRILNHDPSLELPDMEDREPAVREARKLVTAVVVRVAVVSLAPVDPELELRAVGRMVEEARAIAAGNGGVVHEELGGRVALVFGAPELHEDDAIRAVRTAAELREASRTWSEEVPADGALDFRVGIASGDVLVQRTGWEEVLLSADPVRVADQLSAVAHPGEILLTRAAMRLSDGAVLTDEAAPIVIDVGPSPISAFRLAAIGERTQRRLDRPLVGRTEELGLLRQTLARVVREKTSSLVTVIGAAGVGKSRLVAEFIAEVRGQAKVLAGRCLSYGRESTYWPVAEMVRQATDIGADDAPEAARTKAARIVGEGEDAEFIAEQVTGILGLGTVSPVREDVFWALRRFFEIAAQRRPLILVFDDLHWGEPTLLDLIENIAEASRGTPLMLLCLTRPDLLEHRTGWGGGRIDAANLTLGPLSADQSAQLVANLLHGAELAPDVRTRLLEVAEGHPLFLEELLAMLLEEKMISWSGQRWDSVTDLSQVPIPPTVSALLGARIDRLSAAARSLAEAAAVVGKEFGGEDLAAIAGADVDPVALRELEDRDLILAEGSAPRGRPRFRFRHLLIRDAVYRAMPKDSRARAHESFGTYLEEKAGDRVAEVEEIVGYHLEAAYRYREELGETDPALATRAASRLATAGKRAFLRDEMHPAASLLARALSLCQPDDLLEPEICLHLGVARFDTGDLEEAGNVFERGLIQATRLGAEALRWRLLLESTDLEFWRTPEARDTLQIVALTEKAVGALSGLDDAIGVARAYRLKGDALSQRGRLSEALEAYELGRSHALSVGDQWEASRTTLGVVHGPLPVERCIEVSEDQVRSSRRKNSEAMASLGLALAMDGRADDAKASLDEAVRRARELGVEWKLASISMYYAAALLMADDALAAEKLLRPAVEALQRMGEQSMMSTAVAMLAEALYRQGRLDEAMLATVASEAATASDDLASQMAWRGVRGKILAERGEHREAVAVARSAVSFADQTDQLTMAGDAYLDLATVLVKTGRPTEAEGVLKVGLGLYRRKGNRVSAARAQRLLGSLEVKPLERA